MSTTERQAEELKERQAEESRPISQGHAAAAATARLLSIQVGLPATHVDGDSNGHASGNVDGSGDGGDGGQSSNGTGGAGGAGGAGGTSWHTGFYKSPVAGPVWLGRTNLVGDGQADVRAHGGPDKAVLAYAASHYPRWRAELDWPDLPFGAFAENFTLDGLTEHQVCLGDVYAVGDARVQVSQPRSPCWKIARRWRRPDLTARVEATGRTGWYLRVLQEGFVEAGQAFTLLERPHPEWTIARVAATARNRARDPQAAADLGSLPALSAAWRRALGAG